MVEAEEQKLKAREDAIHEQGKEHEKSHKQRRKEPHHDDKEGKKAS